jgi:hypothetical protein
MPYTIKLELPLSDDHYKAIGRVAANWSMIESSLERYIWFLLSWGEDVGRCVTTYMGFGQRMQTLLTLAHDTFSLNGESWRENELATLTRFLEVDLNKNLRVERNNIVHGIWSRDDEDTLGVIKTVARKELHVAVQPHTPTTIEDLADRIEMAFIRLNELLLTLNPKNEIGLDNAPTWLDTSNWQGSGRG